MKSYNRDLLNKFMLVPNLTETSGSKFRLFCLKTKCCLRLPTSNLYKSCLLLTHSGANKHKL